MFGILAESGDAVWTMWVKPLLDQRGQAPGIRNIREANPLELAHPPPQPKINLQANDPLTQGWINTVSMSTQDHQVQKYLEECDSTLKKPCHHTSVD